MEAIPFHRVLRIRKPPMLRYPPLIITYQKENGLREDLTLIPTFMMTGGLFGKSKVEESLNDAIARSPRGTATLEAN